jgi:fluoroacetyl-CoA thioesterase
VEFEPGLRASVRIVVADADTAIAAGSGDVPVLATPRLLALAEAAAVKSVTPALSPGQTTVGTSAVVEHNRASPVGAEVTLEAELIGAEGRLLTFRFTARQGQPGSPAGEETVVGTGTMGRAVVDRERFLARAREA